MINVWDSKYRFKSGGKWMFYFTLWHSTDFTQRYTGIPIVLSSMVNQAWSIFFSGLMLALHFSIELTPDVHACISDVLTSRRITERKYCVSLECVNNEVFWSYPDTFQPNYKLREIVTDSKHTFILYVGKGQ